MAPTTVLLDTSAAIPLVLADHADHAAVRRATGGRRIGLAGHAAFESYSVITRLPAPARRSPAATRRLLATSFPATRHLPEAAAAKLLDELASLGIAGGAVYDALVGSAAAHHELPLLTRDARACETYRLVGAAFELLA